MKRRMVTLLVTLLFVPAMMAATEDIGVYAETDLFATEIAIDGSIEAEDEGNSFSITHSLPCGFSDVEMEPEEKKSEDLVCINDPDPDSDIDTNADNYAPEHPLSFFVDDVAELDIIEQLEQDDFSQIEELNIEETEQSDQADEEPQQIETGSKTPSFCMDDLKIGVRFDNICLITNPEGCSVDGDIILNVDLQNNSSGFIRMKADPIISDEVAALYATLGIDTDLTGKIIELKPGEKQTLAWTFSCRPGHIVRLDPRVIRAGDLAFRLNISFEGVVI